MSDFRKNTDLLSSNRRGKEKKVEDDFLGSEFWRKLGGRLAMMQTYFQKEEVR